VIEFKSEQNVVTLHPAEEGKVQCEICGLKFSKGPGFLLHKRTHNPSTSAFTGASAEAKSSHLKLAFEVQGVVRDLVNQLLEDRTPEEKLEDSVRLDVLQQHAAHMKANTERLLRLKSNERMRRRDLEEAQRRMGSQKRKTYTPFDKAQALDEFDALMQQKDANSRYGDLLLELAQRTGIPKGTLQPWVKEPEYSRIRNAVAQKYSKELLRVDTHSRRVPKYPLMEEEVMKRLRVKRAKGRKVSPRWLSRTAVIW